RCTWFALSCEVLADGSCSPPPDYSLPYCNGCYQVLGRHYDIDNHCFLDSESVVFACTSDCVAYQAQQCYVRDDGGTSTYVYADTGYQYHGVFEAETGFVPCAPGIGTEMAAAGDCGG
ncbi:MAG: hypothetical protein ACOC1F_11645, partial [Myxococcota bacterium]